MRRNITIEGIKGKLVSTFIHERAGLDADLDTSFIASSFLERWEEVSDVIPRMAVQTSAQSLLVKEVSNQTDGATQNEETIENTHLEVVLGLLGAEGTTVAQEIHKADSNAAVDVEDQVVLLGGGHSLDSDGVVEKLVAGEVLHGELLDKLDTEIGVVTRLDSVANTRN